MQHIIFYLNILKLFSQFNSSTELRGLIINYIFSPNEIIDFMTQLQGGTAFFHVSYERKLVILKAHLYTFLFRHSCSYSKYS